MINELSTEVIKYDDCLYILPLKRLPPKGKGGRSNPQQGREMG